MKRGQIFSLGVGLLWLLAAIGGDWARAQGVDAKGGATGKDEGFSEAENKGFERIEAESAARFKKMYQGCIGTNGKLEAFCVCFVGGVWDDARSEQPLFKAKVTRLCKGLVEGKPQNKGDDAALFSIVNENKSCLGDDNIKAEHKESLCGCVAGALSQEDDKDAQFRAYVLKGCRGGLGENK